MSSKRKKQKQKQDQVWHEEVRESLHRVWLAGLGALSAAEQEGDRLFSRLVERGHDYQRELDSAGKAIKTHASELGAQARSSLQRAEEQLEQRLEPALERLGVPTRKELTELERRVAELERKLTRKRAPAKPRSKPAARRKTSKRSASRKA